MSVGQRFTLTDVREKTYKPRDAWWTVLLVDPLASRLVLLVANRTRITPNQLTFLGFVLGLGAAAAFSEASRTGLIAGALLYHVSFVVDCMDGKIARLKGTGSVFGLWLDYIFDRLRVMACSIGLFWGRFRVTGDETYLFLAFVVMFLDMLRYMDALQVYKIRQTLMSRIEAASGDLVPTPSASGDVPADPGVTLIGRIGLYRRIRDRLIRARIRPHVFSGIEFQMFVFIVAPLAGVIRPTVIAGSALLLVFEAIIVANLWSETRHAEERLEAIARGDPGLDAAGRIGGKLADE